MSADLLLRQFERIAEEPGAVDRLRDFTRKLAVNGSLLHADRLRWSDFTLGDLGRWGSGGTPSKSHPEYYEGDIPWLVIGDLNDGRVSSAASTIGQLGLANSSAKLVEPETVLVAMYGSIGKLGLAGIRCATNQAIAHCVVNPVLVTPVYLMVALRSMRRELLARGQGGTQPNISQTILKAWPIRLPPLAEQQRIVAKVDELMALCDQLEAAQSEREARRDRLRTTSLRNLISPDETKENVNFILRHSTRMISKPDHVAGVRQAILALAMRGRLVPQAPEDEPVAALVSSIRSKRPATTRSYAQATDDTDYTDSYPTTWAVTTIGALFDVYVGSTPSRTDSSLWGGEIPWVSSGEVAFNRIRSTREVITGKALGTSSTRLHPPGTVMLSMIGQGKTRGQAAILEVAAAHNQNCASIRVADTPVPPEYIYLMLAERYERTRLQAEGGSQPALNKEKVRAIRFGLPPLAEQNFIVAKVDELMAVCDELEQSLATEQTERARLLEALLHDALKDPLPVQELEPVGAL